MIKVMGNTKNTFFILISAAFVIIIISIGPMDVFTHGNYCDVINLSDINPEDFLGKIELSEGAYTGWFVPAKRHFKGFEILLDNLAEKGKGILSISVSDENGMILSTAEISLSKIEEQQWYRVHLDVNLKQGTKYYYTIEARECPIFPCLQIVDTDYLGDENKEDGVLIGYMYAKSTFIFPEKVLFVILLLSVWVVIAAHFYLENRRKTAANFAAVVFLLVFGLSWNYMFNSIDNQNISFANFQEDSETLVTGTIYAEWGVLRSAYGLGRYYDLKGGHSSNVMSFVNDDNWMYGYSRTGPVLAVANHSGTQIISEAGKYIRFANEDVLEILYSEISGNFIHIYLDADGPLNYYKYGSLSEAQILDGNMQLITTDYLDEYKSQYGLQGKIFRYASRYMDSENILLYLNFLCCVITAFVLAAITMLIKMKYNFLMAGCFYAVFLLSPWVVNFARNLYWVEFTWFLPLLAGLFCSIFIKKKGCRVFSYFFVFVTITVKCLCGYEYITTIMLGIIMFLLADICKALINRDRENIFLLVKAVVILGIMALCGFITAICIHASKRGEGNILLGIQNIIENDVLRRTFGGDMNNFAPEYWESIQVSGWEVFCRYFHFNTEIAAGIPGNLFPILCLTPLLIFAYDYIKKCIDWDDVFLYIICFVVSVSWYFLGKQHSYIHVHMNYVLWYFGYVQMCTYVIVKQIVFRRQ